MDNTQVTANQNNDLSSQQASPAAQNQSASSTQTEPSTSTTKLFINTDICIRCQTCVMMHPEYFEVLEDGAVKEKGDGSVPAEKVDEIMSVCPVGAVQKK